MTMLHRPAAATAERVCLPPLQSSTQYFQTIDIDSHYILQHIVIRGAMYYYQAFYVTPTTSVFYGRL